MFNLLICLHLIVLLSLMKSVNPHNSVQVYMPQSLELFKNNPSQASAYPNSSLIRPNFKQFSNTSLESIFNLNRTSISKFLLNSKMEDDNVAVNCKRSTTCLSCMKLLNCTWCSLESKEGCQSKINCKSVNVLSACAPVVLFRNRRYEWLSFESLLILKGEAFKLSLNHKTMLIQLANKQCKVKEWTFSLIKCIIQRHFEPRIGSMKMILDQQEFIIGDFAYHNSTINNITPSFIIATRDSPIWLRGDYFELENVVNVTFGNRSCINIISLNNTIKCLLKAHKTELSKMINVTPTIDFSREIKTFSLVTLYLGPTPVLTSEPIKTYTYYEKELPIIAFHGQNFYKIKNYNYKISNKLKCLGKEISTARDCKIINKQRMFCSLPPIPIHCFSNLTTLNISIYVSQSNFGFKRNITLKFLNFEKNYDPIVIMPTLKKNIDLIIHGIGFNRVNLKILNIFCSYENKSFSCAEKRMINNYQIFCNFKTNNECFSKCHLNVWYRSSRAEIGYLIIADNYLVFYMYMYVFTLFAMFTTSFGCLVSTNKNKYKMRK